MAAVTESLKGRHFTSVADWSGEELLQALDLAYASRNGSPGARSTTSSRPHAGDDLHAQKALMALVIS
jgi:ornithine carbamoyltransferase